MHNWLWPFHKIFFFSSFLFIGFLWCKGIYFALNMIVKLFAKVFELETFLWFVFYILKINLYCNDSLLPSTSDKNTSKYTEWIYDGSGAVSLYVNQRSLDILQDPSSTPKYIWLLESKQIIQGFYDWILSNYDFVASRVDGIFSCQPSKFSWWKK